MSWGAGERLQGSPARPHLCAPRPNAGPLSACRRAPSPRLQVAAAALPPPNCLIAPSFYAGAPSSSPTTSSSCRMATPPRRSACPRVSCRWRALPQPLPVYRVSVHIRRFSPAGCCSACTANIPAPCWRHVVHCSLLQLLLSGASGLRPAGAIGLVQLHATLVSGPTCTSQHFCCAFVS